MPVAALGNGRRRTGEGGAIRTGVPTGCKRCRIGGHRGARTFPIGSEWGHADGQDPGSRLRRKCLDKLVLARKVDLRLQPRSSILWLACRPCFHGPRAAIASVSCRPQPDGLFSASRPRDCIAAKAGRLLCEAMAGTRMRGNPEHPWIAGWSAVSWTATRSAGSTTTSSGVCGRSLADLCRSLTDGTGPYPSSSCASANTLTRAFRGELHCGGRRRRARESAASDPGRRRVSLGKRALRHSSRRPSPTIGDGMPAPVGWVGRDAAEFAVAIRSGLVEGSTLSVFAGAGIVTGSKPGSEWRELDCKVSHFTRRAEPAVVMRAPNLNHLWATLLIEELVRNGVDTFCIAPGSRSAPLSVAVARHDRARCIVHHDERGAAFHALGYARASAVFPRRWSRPRAARWPTSGRRWWRHSLEQSPAARPQRRPSAGAPGHRKRTRPWTRSGSSAISCGGRQVCRARRRASIPRWC